VDAALEWSIQKIRKTGGARAGGFPGADVILPQLSGESPTQRRLVGLRCDSRPVRAGTTLFADERSSITVGHITSGGFGPTANGPVSMGYVARDFFQVGTTLFAEVRNERHPIVVASLPFVAHRYKR